MRAFKVKRGGAIAVLFAVLLLAAPAAASTAAAETNVNQAVVKTVTDYLEGLTTLKAHFVQTAEDGTQRAGTFYLNRPGKMRIVYDPPDKDFIVADGLFIHYYDASTERTSSALISSSVADFFLRKHLKVAGNVSVSAAAQKGNLLSMTVVQTKNPLAGSLTLVFGKAPLRLTSWSVVDAEGLTTTVALSNIKTGIKFKSDLFHYYDPARAAHLYNEN